MRRRLFQREERAIALDSGPWGRDSVPSDRLCGAGRPPCSLADNRSIAMIRKLASGQYRLYSRKVDAKTGKRRNLGTFDSLEKAQQHEREVQYFKRHG
jgi:hypothetical protein